VTLKYAVTAAISVISLAARSCAVVTLDRPI
jgi:hypothetical protein